jgi:hypothetical protein
MTGATKSILRSSLEVPYFTDTCVRIIVKDSKISLVAIGAGIIGVVSAVETREMTGYAKVVELEVSSQALTCFKLGVETSELNGRIAFCAIDDSRSIAGIACTEAGQAHWISLAIIIISIITKTRVIDNFASVI